MVYIVGHRGAPFYKPENTIGSFKKAIEFKVDFIECDVHLTKDEEVVVIHDDTLNRTTNGSGYIKDFTLREIKELLIEKESKIPTLDEVLKLNFPTIIELKPFKVSGRYKSYPNLVNEVLEITKNYKQKLIFMSFNKEYLEQLKESITDKFFLSLNFLSKLDELKKINLMGVGIKYTSLNSRNIELAHKNNFQVLAWTVDKKEDIEKLSKLKVDFIASNNPKLALETIKGQ